MHNILTAMSVPKVLRHFSMYLHHLQGISSYIIVNLLLLLILLLYYTFVGLNKQLYKMHGAYIKKVSSLFQ
jgi:hypothetical protein